MKTKTKVNFFFITGETEAAAMTQVRILHELRIMLKSFCGKRTEVGIKSYQQVSKTGNWDAPPNITPAQQAAFETEAAIELADSVADLIADGCVVET